MQYGKMVKGVALKNGSIVILRMWIYGKLSHSSVVVALNPSVV